MKLKTLFAAATAGFLMTGVALAADQDVLDRIIADLSTQGFTRIHISHSDKSITVEASGPGLSVERTYTADGTLRKEEVVTADGKVERRYDEAGNVVGEETSAAGNGGFIGDDDGYDDDGDDDNGSDDDDGDDHEDDGEDDDDDDGGDDDGGDDHDDDGGDDGGDDDGDD